MSNRKQLATLSSQLQNLTIKMVSRIQQGNTTLDRLEKSLLDMVYDEHGELIGKDAHFLLRICQYFRSSVTNETRAVWEFMLNLQRGKVPPGVSTPEEESPVSGYRKQIENMDSSKREHLRQLFKHKNCKYFSEGRCSKYDKSVDPEGDGCESFEVKEAVTV